MARRYAFIVGSNSSEKFGKLRYAESDADRIGKLLKSSVCKFEVIRPNPSDGGDEAFKAFKDITTSCRDEDIFVCYFAGHGEAIKGELFLIWDNHATDLLRDGVPFNNLLTYFKHCRADNKLFILDCCKAGSASVNIRDVSIDVREVVQGIDTSSVKPENQLVLAASERVGRVREFPEYEGSFLAAQISNALSRDFDKADADQDKRISIYDLQMWLESKAAEHNRVFIETDKKIDEPFFLNIGGKTKGKFYLTVDLSEWVPYEVPLPDESNLVVLPIRPEPFDSPEAKALCVAKYPVTNRQYKQFVKETGHPVPVGKNRVFAETQKNGIKSIILGEWHEPFYPWREKNFSSDEQPVVCVSHDDALAYSNWVNTKLAKDNLLRFRRCFLPTMDLWNFAAFENENSPRDSYLWLNMSRVIHQKATYPASIDLTGSRDNKLGISDLIGNVWEWCDKRRGHHPSAYNSSWIAIELRGGCFHDGFAASLIEPFLQTDVLIEKEKTRHFDIGFRVAGMVYLNSLPEEVQERLKTSKRASSYIWYTYSF